MALTEHPPARVLPATEGNERLTALTAMVLLVLLAVEGVTIVWLRPFLTVHLFVGLMLIPPVGLKLASTGYRFARYYTRNAGYRRKGPPPALLRWTAPGRRRDDARGARQRRVDAARRSPLTRHGAAVPQDRIHRLARGHERPCARPRDRAAACRGRRVRVARQRGLAGEASPWHSRWPRASPSPSCWRRGSTPGKWRSSSTTIATTVDPCALGTCGRARASPPFQRGEFAFGRRQRGPPRVTRQALSERGVGRRGVRRRTTDGGPQR